MKGYVIKVLAGLTVAALCSIGGAIWQARKDQQRLEAAPRVYVNQLDLLIQRAVGEGEDRAILNARAIVAARNSLATSLMGISGQLDGEIDKLAQEIGEPTLKPGSLALSSNKEPDKKAAYQTILVLQRVWPTKKQQIEFEIRKLLAEMGLPLTAATREPETPSDQVSPTPEVKSPVAPLPSPQESRRSELVNKPSPPSQLLPPLLGSSSPTDDDAIYTAGRDGVTAPQITFKPTPGYTAAAHYARTEGVVRVSAILRKDGSVTDIKVTGRLGQGLDEQAIRATRAVRFIPGQKNHQPVNVRMTFEYTFTID